MQNVEFSILRALFVLEDQTLTSQSLFPPGTPVCVRQVVVRRGEPLVAETVGVVEAWSEEPTGSWHAHGKEPQSGPAVAEWRGRKLWLDRLRLRKVDGEVALLVIDDATQIARLEAVPDE